jgi:hypothetical protein
MTEENFGMYAIWDEEIQVVVEALELYRDQDNPAKDLVARNVQDRLQDAVEELTEEGRIK